jgi:HlyD family secretion protein
VLAPAKVDVGATITGRVQKVTVDDGAKIAAGALLIELERSELEAALAQERATERAEQTRITQWR